MFSMKRYAETQNVDPFEGILIRSAGFDEGNGIKNEVDYSLADAVHFGESRYEEAIGFSINGTEFRFPKPIELHQAAWEVMSIAAQFGSAIRASMDTSLEILEAYFFLVQGRDEEVVIDLIPSTETVKRIKDAYIGRFYHVESFIKKIREDYKEMSAEDFTYLMENCTASIKNHYFQLA